jgi:hypothetical protein
VCVCVCGFHVCNLINFILFTCMWPRVTRKTRKYNSRIWILENFFLIRLGQMLLKHRMKKRKGKLRRTHKNLKSISASKSFKPFLPKKRERNQNNISRINARLKELFKSPSFSSVERERPIAAAITMSNF